MKTIFVIGGMGAGKSSVTRILAAQGLPAIDLDQVGHEVLLRDDVKRDLAQAFGAQVIAPGGAVDRVALSQAAFATSEATARLNAITHPAIEQALREKLAAYAAEGREAAVVELSSFDGTRPSLTALADCIVLVSAPEGMRVQRAVASGWRAEDVRARIARQLSDDERKRFAHVVFDNKESSEQLSEQVISWWRSYKEQGFPKLQTVYERGGGDAKKPTAPVAAPEVPVVAAVTPSGTAAPVASSKVARPSEAPVPAAASVAELEAEVSAGAPMAASKKRDDICG